MVYFHFIHAVKDPEWNPVFWGSMYITCTSSILYSVLIEIVKKSKVRNCFRVVLFIQLNILLESSPKRTIRCLTHSNVYGESFSSLLMLKQ